MARRPSQMSDDLDKFLNKVVSGTLITMQSELGSKKVSPYQSGRLRSSWFAAEGSPSQAVAPEGANGANTDATGLRVDWRREYHLTNNVPYIEAVAIEGRVVSQPTTWLADFLGSRVQKIVDASVRAANQ